MKRTVRGMLVVLALLLWGMSAGCAETDVDGVLDKVELEKWQAVADEGGAGDIAEMIRSAAAGKWELDAQSLYDRLAENVRAQAEKILPGMAAILAPAVIWVIVSQFAADGAGMTAAMYIAYLTCACALANLYVAQLTAARTIIGWIVRMTDALAPVMTSLVTLTGSTGAAGLMTPMGTLAGGMLTGAVQSFGLAMCAFAAIAATAGNMTKRMKLEKLYKLIRSIGNWGMGTVMSAYLVLMSARSVIGNSQDGITLRAARYAADNLLPVVGGDVADTMDVLASSAVLVKNAAGITGVWVLAAACIGPVVGILLALFSLRAAAAIVEPLAEGALARMIDDYAGAFAMLLTVVATAITLGVIYLGAVLGVGNRLAA